MLFLNACVHRYIIRISVDDEDLHAYTLPDQTMSQNTVKDLKESLRSLTATGSPGKTRTYNTPVNSRVLCH